MPKPNARMFQAQHHNAIAKDIREEYESYATETPDFQPWLDARRALECLALRFCDRFAIDNFEFDPVKFLNQCSPDVDSYPLGELWNG